MAAAQGPKGKGAEVCRLLRAAPPARSAQRQQRRRIEGANSLPASRRRRADWNTSLLGRCPDRLAQLPRQLAQVLVGDDQRKPAGSGPGQGIPNGPAIPRKFWNSSI